MKNWGGAVELLVIKSKATAETVIMYRILMA